MFLVSPLSGSYNYIYDEANEFWKAPVQTHILDDLLLREWLTICNGTLDL